MTGHPTLHRIADRIAELCGRCRPGVSRPGLLVALSGGPDSVALLLGARLWASAGGGALEAAHLDHTLRGEEAAADLRFCRDLCTGLGVPLHEFRRDPRPLARSRGRGLEEAGRHLRLTLFGEVVAAAEHLHCLATGHHRDDQIETVLMRLFRGTGPDGLLGIPPVDGAVIHPLLEIRRAEILACLADLGQPWRRDPTNEAGGNVRARLRRELIPLVADIFGSGSAANPARLADLLAGDLDLLADLTRRELAAVLAPGSPDALRVGPLLALPPALGARVLRAWLAVAAEAPDPGSGGDDPAGPVPDGWSRAHIDAIWTWLREGQSGTGLDLPGRRRLVRDFDLVRLQAPAAGLPLRPAADYRIVVRTAPPAADPAALGAAEGCGRQIGPHAWELSCPAACLQGNLQVRNPRPGDRIQPFGLAGTKKLSDLLRELQVAAAERPQVLVVADREGPLWVVGLARSERTRLLPSTDRIVTLCVAQRVDNPQQGNTTA